MLLCQDVLQPTVMLSVNARVPTDDDAVAVPTDDAAITPAVAPSVALTRAVVLPQAPHGSSKEAETDDRSPISSSSSLGDGTFGREEGNDDLTHLFSKLTDLLSNPPGEIVMSMDVANIVFPELMRLSRAEDQDRVLKARMAAVPSVGTRGEVVLPSVLSSSAGTAPSTGEVSHWKETGSLKLSQEPFSELTELASEVAFPVSCGSNNLQETELATIPKLSTKCHLGAASEHHSGASVAVKSHNNATIAAPTGTAAFPQASNRPGADPASQCPGTEPASTTAPQAPTRPRAETANLSQEQGGGESCSNLATTVNSLLEEAACLLEAVPRDDTSMLAEGESSVPELALHGCDAATVAPVEVSAGSADIQCSTVPSRVSSFMARIGLRRSTLGMRVPDGVI